MQITNTTTKETKGTLVTDVTVTFQTVQTIERQDSILKSLSLLQKSAETVKGRNLFKNLYHLYTFLAYNANQLYDSTMISYADEDNAELTKAIEEEPYHATFDFRKLDDSRKDRSDVTFMHLKNNFIDASYEQMTTSLIINQDVAKVLYAMNMGLKQIKSWALSSSSIDDAVAGYHVSENIGPNTVYNLLTDLDELVEFFDNLVNTVVTEMYLPKI